MKKYFYTTVLALLVLTGCGNIKETANLELPSEVFTYDQEFEVIEKQVDVNSDFLSNKEYVDEGISQAMLLGTDRNDKFDKVGRFLITCSKEGRIENFKIVNFTFYFRYLEGEDCQITVM